MEKSMLKPFYEKVKETEKECGYPIEALHGDLVIDIFDETVLKDFEIFYRNKTVQEIINSLLFISKKWLGNQLVCQLMLMMDEWEHVDELYEHEELKNYY